MGDEKHSPRSRPVRILIVDGHAAARDGLALLLSRQPDLAVVGATGGREEALRLAAMHSPDVVVIDTSLVSDGGSLCEQFRKAYPATRILAWSLHSDGQAQQVCATLADAYILKELAPTEIIPAICRLLNGNASH